MIRQKKVDDNVIYKMEPKIQNTLKRLNAWPMISFFNNQELNDSDI